MSDRKRALGSAAFRVNVTLPSDPQDTTPKRAATAITPIPAITPSHAPHTNARHCGSGRGQGEVGESRGREHCAGEPHTHRDGIENEYGSKELPQRRQQCYKMH